MAKFFGRRRDRRPARIGLALGSGAARGWAHIGVVRALVESGLEVEYVAGTSIGSLVGAAFASGKMDSLETVVRELDWKRAMTLFDMSLPRSGLLDGHNVTAAIREHVESGSIEDLPVPFCAVSTDLVDGREVRIREGDIIEAIRASISVPGVFTPVRRGERLLVDGGLVNPVPTGVVREMGAEYVIAVDLNHGVAGVGSAEREGLAQHEAPDDRGRDESAADRLRAELSAIWEKLGAANLPGVARARKWFEQESVPNILEVVISSMNIMEKQITEMQLAKEPPDLLLRPHLAHMSPMDFHRGDEAIAEGHRAATVGLAGLSLPRS